MYNKFKKEIRKKGNVKRAKLLQRFFKTGKGEYGEGDFFMGITVPEIRKLAKKVNNWDLVDLSAQKIVGEYLLDKPKKILYKLARSKNLWERRISVISTFYFIKNNKFKETLKISNILLCDSHDLIHKAVGWALREVGKKSLKTEEKFLKKYCLKMPRTMLRYAI